MIRIAFLLFIWISLFSCKTNTEFINPGLDEYFYFNMTYGDNEINEEIIFSNLISGRSSAFGSSGIEGQQNRIRIKYVHEYSLGYNPLMDNDIILNIWMLPYGYSPGVDLTIENEYSNIGSSHYQDFDVTNLVYSNNIVSAEFSGKIYSTSGTVIPVIHGSLRLYVFRPLISTPLSAYVPCCSSESNDTPQFATEIQPWYNNNNTWESFQDRDWVYFTGEIKSNYNVSGVIAYLYDSNENFIHSFNNGAWSNSKYTGRYYLQLLPSFYTDYFLSFQSYYLSSF